MHHHPLLIEIGTEELPAHGLAPLAQSFQSLMTKALIQQNFEVQSARAYATPRRLAVYIDQLADQQNEQTIERKGPSLKGAFDSNGDPTPAALGFAKSCQVPFEQLERLSTPKGEWLAYKQTQSGQPLRECLPGILDDVLKKLPLGKRMRWGSLEESFLRPVHWLCILHGSVPLPYCAFGLKASAQTFGHRFHAPSALTLSHAKDYESVLIEAKVIPCFEARKQRIRTQIDETAARLNGVAVCQEALLEEVTGLVEWPEVLHAHFDPSFLNVPKEALISAMEHHQKCFPILNQQEKLLPFFILVSNITSKHPPLIVQGNERVMNARLSDAKFFFEKDLDTPLEKHLEGLKKVTFQHKLGSLFDKTQRLERLISKLAPITGADPSLCQRAARLSKCDLLTQMVFEFPELQGIMGRYYALADKEPNDVAKAIEHSYWPKFSGDQLPTEPVAFTLAIADRIDTLVGIFGIGLTPTGVKDPFALRRSALGILRIIIENQIPLDLAQCLQWSVDTYACPLEQFDLDQVMAFIFSRFKAFAGEQAISPVVFEAVLATHPQQAYDFYRRIKAVNHFLSLEQAQSLSQANKRVRNILAKNHQLALLNEPLQIDHTLLAEPCEHTLSQSIEALEQQVRPLVEQGEYTQALGVLADLKDPLDHFFEEVMVMAEDPALRHNRLSLLAKVLKTFLTIADISKL